MGFTTKRYKAISSLSNQVDSILHSRQRTNFAPDKEGELALLSSEIYKMTMRLQEQTELLQKEKSHLSSSIADISHQIRTPLTSIRMLVPRLGRKELQPEQRSEYIREIVSLLTRIEWLIAALLKIAQLESGVVAFEQTPIKVKELIQKSLAPLEILLEIKDIALEITIADNVCFKGDFFWSMEAIGNILKNCLEHIPENGAVKITASENPLYTEIIISDTGSGIAIEDLPHLFERFYKGKNSGPGNMGIGLALSRMIISRQNGTIKAQNSNPYGAEFHIRFYKGAV
ncbi:HAMP domain-containing sensor histidine kinase [Kineothrix sedimenti]|uniref:histidine kinase n=1 Tax=Kineothrix sedimenti TaxID=3123317 RepID=A0ABZ3F3K6_9FIRM